MYNSHRHILGLYVFNSIYRFCDTYSDEQFRRLTQYGLPPHFLAWHEGTNGLDEVRERYAVVTWREWKAVHNNDTNYLSDRSLHLPVHPETWLEAFQKTEQRRAEMHHARQVGYHYELKRDGFCRSIHATRKLAETALRDLLRAWRTDATCTTEKYNQTSYGLKCSGRLTAVINLVLVLHGEG